jgi:hypothetical protein
MFENGSGSVAFGQQMASGSRARRDGSSNGQNVRHGRPIAAGVLFATVRGLPIFVSAPAKFRLAGVPSLDHFGKPFLHKADDVIGWARACLSKNLTRTYSANSHRDRINSDERHLAGGASARI